MPKEVSFENFSLPHAIDWYVPDDQAIPASPELFLWMDDVACNEGVRFGIKYPEGRDGCCVSATMDVSKTDTAVCCTTWGSDVVSALTKMFLILHVWDGIKDLSAAHAKMKTENQRIREWLESQYRQSHSKGADKPRK